MSRFPFLRSNRQAPASGKAGSDFAAGEDFDVAAAGPKRGSRQKEAADPALPEKKRARRRLVGAITLTLTAVIALPLVFDPEPKPAVQEIAIDVVSSRSKTTPPAKAAAPEPASEPQPVASAAPAAGTVVAGTATAAPAEAPRQPARPVESAPQPAVEAKAAAKEQDKFIIQVAALASQQKVSELQARLKSAGIKSYTQKVSTQSGERIRVRIGPLPTRKEADGMCAKLGKIGQQCTIVPA